MSRGVVWDAASRIRDPCYITVEYDSTRSDEIQTMRGKVIEVVARADSCVIRARRDDGQKIEVNDDGKLLSIGSDFPVTGFVNDIEVEYDTNVSVFGG